MPEWKPFTKDCRATMVFDRESECKAGYDDELNELLTKYQPPFRFGFRIPDDDEEEQGRLWLY